MTPRSTATPFASGISFALPALEESNTDKPHHTATRSTSTFGGVASNTGIIRPVLLIRNFIKMGPYTV